jgi:CubicO group peptidase (beta-lactamase class C family)
MSHEKFLELEDQVKTEHPNITGIVVLKDGETRYEKYFNGCTGDSRVHVYSVTKSIVSLLIGIARDKGFIKSINQRVLDFFPEYIVKKHEKTIRSITLKDMLTMTVPYKYRLNPPYIKYFTSDDSVRFTLDLVGGLGKIGKFRYAPLIGPDILSGILVQATGRTVLDFASENLFSPLGIAVKGSIRFQSKEEQLAFNKATDISGWAADAKGINTGGWGLTLSPMDMAKIGQLLIDDGKRSGKEIVSPQWIQESTKKHSGRGKLIYGYLWWIIDADERIFAALGDGGNTIYVNAKKRIVVSIASLFMPRVKDRIELIRKYIDPR